MSHHHHHHHHHNSPINNLSPEEREARKQQIIAALKGNIPVIQAPTTSTEVILAPPIQNGTYDASAAQAHLKKHKHHHHKGPNQFWQTVFLVSKIVAIGAVATFAPPLIGAAIPLIGSMGLVGTALAAGVSCAATDAVFQGAAIELRMQEHFSVNEVIETAMGSGIGAGVAAAGAGFIVRAASTGASAALSQGAEIALGTREKMDLKAIGMQVASSLVSSAVNELMSSVNSSINNALPDAIDTIGKENVSLVTNTVANSTANTALDCAVNDKPFTAQGVLLGSVGSIIGSKLGSLIKDNLNIPTTNQQGNTLSKDSKEDNSSIGDELLKSPTEAEMQDFLNDIDATLEQINAITPSSNNAQTEISTEDLIKSIPCRHCDSTPINIAQPQEPSFYESLSTPQKVLIGAGLGAAVVLALPAEVTMSAALIISRVGAATIAGPVAEVLEVDAAAGEAIANTAIGAKVATASGKIADRVFKFFKPADTVAEKAVITEVKTANTATKERVLENIGESKAARESSNFPVHGAKENQVQGRYNADNWGMEDLKEGEIIHGGLPGQSNYYTNKETILLSEGDKDSLGQILQVQPHPEWGYRNQVGEYLVKKNISVPAGEITANPQLGIGGGKQYYINNHKNNLELTNTYDLEEFHELNVQRNKFSP